MERGEDRDWKLGLGLGLEEEEEDQRILGFFGRHFC